MLSEEAANTNFYNFWFYPIVALTHNNPHSWEHANHYTTGVVFCIWPPYHWWGLWFWPPQAKRWFEIIILYFV